MDIEILGHKWKIKLKDKENMDQKFNYSLGLTSFPSREILILDTLKGAELEQVATHEVVHALLDEFGCSNIENFNDEFICDFIANNILLILKISDKITNYIDDNR